MLIDFHCTFSVSCKIMAYIMFINVVYGLGTDRQSGLLSFVSAFLFSLLTPLFLPSCVSLSYFILAVPMRECLRKHSCTSAPFPIAILVLPIFSLWFKRKLNMHAHRRLLLALFLKWPFRPFNLKKLYNLSGKAPNFVKHNPALSNLP